MFLLPFYHAKVLTVMMTKSKSQKYMCFSISNANDHTM